MRPLALALLVAAGCASPAPAATPVHDPAPAVVAGAMPLPPPPPAAGCAEHRYTARIDGRASDEETAAIAAALGAWADASGGVVAIVAFEHDAGDTVREVPACTIGFRVEAPPTGYEGWDDTTANADARGTTSSAIVTLAPWLTGNALRAVALHETGHAFGLTHTTDPADVMFPDPTALALSVRDRSRFCDLYRCPGLAP